MGADVFVSPRIVFLLTSKHRSVLIALDLMDSTCQLQHTSLFILLQKHLKIGLRNLSLYIFKVDLYLKPSNGGGSVALNIRF